MKRLIPLLALIALCTQAAFAATTLGPGNPQRRAILDALRPPVRQVLKKPVIFKVDHLKQQGEWAFMSGKPQGPGGKKMDYRGTRYQSAKENGAFDDWICALFRKRNGKWRVVEYAIGATDVVWDGWDKKHRAPRSIFPSYN